MCRLLSLKDVQKHRDKAVNGICVLPLLVLEIIGV